MANLGRGRVRTRQLFSVLPIYLFSISFLALAMGEKRKISGQRRQRKQKGIGAELYLLGRDGALVSSFLLGLTSQAKLQGESNLLEFCV